ncbi:hypothetical protein D3C71_1309410 [compost metagenome]
MLPFKLVQQGLGVEPSEPFGGIGWVLGQIQAELAYLGFGDRADFCVAQQVADNLIDPLALLGRLGLPVALRDAFFAVEGRQFGDLRGRLGSGGGFFRTSQLHPWALEALTRRGFDEGVFTLQLDLHEAPGELALIQFLGLGGHLPGQSDGPGQVCRCQLG